MPKLDREKVKAAGWSDAAIDSYLVAHPNVKELTSARVWDIGATPKTPEPQSLIPSAQAAALTPESPRSAAAQEGPTPQEFFTDIAPSVVAGAASMAVPGAAPAAWLLRMAMAGGAGAGTELGMQQVRGEDMNIPGALMRGGGEMAGQGFGELIPAASGIVGRQLQKSGFNLSKGSKEFALERGRELGGHDVQYKDVDLVNQADKEGVVPGGDRGSPRVRKLRAEPMEERAQIYAKLDADPKVRANLNDLTSGYADLRAEIGTSKQSKKSAWFEKRIRDFAEEMKVSVKRKDGKVVKKLESITPSQMQNYVTKWAKEAEAIYKNPSAPAASRLEAEFKANIAEAGRQWLRDLTPPAVPGGVGRIESLNRRYRELEPLEDATKSAEVPPSNTGSWRDKNPMRLMDTERKGSIGTAMRAASRGTTGRAMTQIPRAAGMAGYSLVELMKMLRQEDESIE